MANEPRLKVRLYNGWRQLESREGPVTYFREGSSDSGALQFSVAQHRPGPVPGAGEEMLIALCEKLTSKVRNRRDASSRSGKCEFGIFATVAVKGDSPAHFQAWVLSNHREFILVTHTCEKQPDPQEIAEANEIALMTGFR
jgi:hypothetical protein